MKSTYINCFYVLQIKSVLFLLYYVEEWKEFAGLISVSLRSGNTVRLEEMVHCVRFDRPEI